MELQNFDSELQELTFEESNGINGGESLWYWVAYGVGTAAHAVVDGVRAVHNALKQPPELIGVK
jgi:hypothetical protein